MSDRNENTLAPGSSEKSPAATSGVQSLERAFELLELFADSAGPIGLTRLAELSRLPPPTIHRLIRTLVTRGYIRQTQDRLYVLGPRFMKLGDAARRAAGTWANHHLEELVELTGETAQLAVLDYDGALAVAQVASKHHMRAFTDVGRRIRLHLSAVGKALLAQMSDQRIRESIDRQGLPAQTPNTITSFERLRMEIAGVRERGYAVDNGEQEVGMRCVAVPVPGMPTMTALGISSPEQRLPNEVIERYVPHLQLMAQRLASDALRGGQGGSRA